jgi:P-type Mg2+ transporter
LTLASAAALSADEVLRRLESTDHGLSRDEAGVRLADVGANALRSHGARPFAVLVRQLRNPLLVLLVAAALTSFAVGERTSALIIPLIICMSVGLGSSTSTAPSWRWRRCIPSCATPRSSCAMGSPWRSM